jgi:tight adherence protein C
MPVAVIFGVILVLFLVVAGVGYALVLELGRSSRLNNRLQLVTGRADHIELDDKPPGSVALQGISALGMLIARSGILSRKTLAEMTSTLEGAGFRGGRGLGLFIGTKILCFFLVPLLIYFLLRHVFVSEFGTIVKIMAGAILGLLLPELYATNIRKRHLAQVELGVADALDMLVICADSGLALEAGLARVAQELGGLNGALAMELTQTSQELSIGSDMRRAMDSLGARTGLQPLKRLATTLAQSLQFGTPLTQALRTLSAELRQEALVKFEERAGRLPTLMTIPMILFILPCVFLIVAGPAIVNVLNTLHGMK